MSARLELKFPLGSEMLTSVRLATGGMCSLAGLDLDDSEDCKVCVTESLLILMHRGYGEAKVVLEEDGGIRVKAEGCGEAADRAENSEDEISFALLSALLGEVTEEKRDGKLCAISFRFARQA